MFALEKTKNNTRQNEGQRCRKRRLVQVFEEEDGLNQLWKAINTTKIYSLSMLMGGGGSGSVLTPSKVNFFHAPNIFVWL